MDIQVIEQNALYSLQYDAPHKVLAFSINGFVNVTQIRNFLARQVDWARDHKVLGICADLSKMDGTISPLAGFIANEYIAPLRELGMYAAAIIVSEEILCRLAARDFVTRMGEKGIVMFHDKVDAMKWLHHHIQNHKVQMNNSTIKL